MNGRTHITFNKIIGVTEDNCIVGIDEFFMYHDSFMGYVGTVFDPVSADEVKRMNSLSYAKEYIKDMFTDEEIKENYGSVTKAAKALIDDEEDEFIGQDTSYMETYADDLLKIQSDGKKLFGFVPKTFTCSGSGRIIGTKSSFNAKTKWKVIYEPDMLKEILSVEK